MILSNRPGRTRALVGASKLLCYPKREANILIKAFWEVGSGDHDDGFVLLEAIHFHKKLIKCLLHVLLIAVAALAADSVEFIDENDGWFLLPCSSEELSDAFSANADEHFFKI